MEGPSDEAVLRIFAETLGLDLTTRNIGFVHMGGIRNFAHFAAEATLDLLSRRQVAMWFVAEHNEMDDQEVKRMMNRLGPHARLEVLHRREMENYLWDESALTKFICQKLRSSDKTVNEPDKDAVEQALKDAIESSKQEVVRLRLTKRLLETVYLRVKGKAETIEESLKNAIQNLEGRLSAIDNERAKVEAEVDGQWSAKAEGLAPGTVVLDRAAQTFGVRFRKDNGDSETLARLVPEKGVHPEIRALLERFAEECPVLSGGQPMGLVSRA